jgi:hypothetical protein
MPLVAVAFMGFRLLKSPKNIALPKKFEPDSLLALLQLPQRIFIFFRRRLFAFILLKASHY